MRVMVVGINYAPDLIGIAKYTTELCESLAAQGHDVRVITAPPYYPGWKIPEEYRSAWYRHETIDKVDVIRAPIYVPGQPSGAKRLLHHASFLLSATPPILSAALTWRPEIVFAVAPSLLSAPMAVLAARISGASSWLHVQDFEVDAAFELGMLKANASARKAVFATESRLLRMFDRVSTISPQMMRLLQRKRVATNNVREFRNWIDTDVIAPRPGPTRFHAELSLKPNDMVALYSGAMSNKQGLNLIVEAAGALKGTHPSLKFILCGDGPAKPSLMQMASGLNNVRFLDLQPLDRFAELLNTADMHLLPQKTQIADLVLPSKLAGMLASGRPIVAMADPGTGIASEVDGAGLIVPPGDARALGEAISTLAADKALRERLGAAGRARAEAKWDRRSVIATLEREFLTLRQPASVAAPHPFDLDGSTDLDRQSP